MDNRTGTWRPGVYLTDYASPDNPANKAFHVLKTTDGYPREAHSNYLIDKIKQNIISIHMVLSTNYLMFQHSTC